MERCLGIEEVVVVVVVVSGTCIRFDEGASVAGGDYPFRREANMGNVPQNKPVAVVITDVLHRHMTSTRGGGRCPLVCHVRRRFHRLAHFDNDALPEARTPRLRTPPIHSLRGPLIVLYFSNTNATGVVFALKSHL